MDQLKNKTVDAEALYKVCFDNKLTSEAKLLIIVARLAGGVVSRDHAPKGRGYGDFDAGRTLLRQQRKADSPNNNPRVVELRDDCFPKLSPKEPKNAKKPTPSTPPKPSPKAATKPRTEGSDSKASG